MRENKNIKCKREKKIQVKKYRNIVFDVGEVLTTYNFAGVMADKYGYDKEEMSRIIRTLGKDELWSEFDYENYTFYQVIDLFCEKYKEDEKNIRAMFDHMGEFAVPYYDIWDLLPELKKVGYKLFLLSNYSSTTFQMQLGDGYFLNYIDGCLFSHEIHEIKPHPIIYQKFFEKNNLVPSECLFFDDREINVNGAIDMGMDAIRVTSKDFLKGKLLELIEIAK